MQSKLQTWMGYATLSFLLAACEDDTGAPCWFDFECFSNSCTWGSCDSLLGAAIGRAITGSGRQTPEPLSEPSRCDVPRCAGLDQETCWSTPGCEVEEYCGYRESCSERLKKGLGCAPCSGFPEPIDLSGGWTSWEDLPSLPTFDNECKAPCELVTECRVSATCW